MAKKDEEEKRGFVGGLVNDLAMGLGLRDRDQRYYDRTAATIGNNQGQAAYDRYRQQTGMAGGAQVGSANMPLRGGLLSAFGVTGPRDFFDGGGLGRSGDTFQGSPYSILLNALGVKPYGYAERQGRADQAIADLQNPAKWMAGYGGQSDGVAPISPAPAQGATPSMTFPMLDEYNVPASAIPSMTFPMLDEYNVPPSASATTLSEVTEPAMNFAQYVEAYRKHEAPLVKSGRLKRETPLDALRNSYNEFFGIK